MTDEPFRRSWWLAAPGPWRRLQFAILWLVLLGLVGLAGGLVATAYKVPLNSALMIGAGVALIAEIAIFGTPARVASEIRFTLPATPERLFAIASDPQMMAGLSPIGLRLVESTGNPGEVGSRYVMTASGLRMAVRVLRSDPPREIVIEMRTRLNRAVTTRRYKPIGDGTEVWMRTEQRMPLGAWLFRPVFRSEVSNALAEGQRRIRAFLETESTTDP